ncbi:hypothetical protein BRI6_0838 [plant metagenome]|uniref:Uncharacterized protein n=1 Tax=plant metagenome TaxID=1297885 RepID=A0A484Y7T5_9ZZZZ
MQRAAHFRQTRLVVGVLALEVLRAQEEAFAPEDFGRVTHGVGISSVRYRGVCGYI